MKPTPEILALVAERTVCGVVLCGLDRRITWVNSGFQRITGYTPDEALGRSPGALLQGEGTDPATVALMRTRLDVGEPVSADLVNYRKGHHPYHIHLEIIPLRTSGGQVEGFLALQRDITAEIQTHRVLEERQASLSEALTFGRMGAWTYEVDQGVFHFTEEFYRVFRTTTAAMGGPIMTPEAYARRFLPEEVRPLVAQETERSLRSDDPNYHRVIDHPVHFADGTTGHIQVSLRTIRDEHGRIYRVVGVNQDITERMAQVHALAQARDQAQASLRAKAAFLAMMSHEIRTPLNGILGMLDLLRSSLPPGEHQENADVGHRSARHLLGLLNDILDHARLETQQLALTIRPYEVTNVVLEAVELFRSQAQQQGLRLAVEIGAGPWRLLGDAQRVRQILANLLGNALKFTTAGRITLRLERRGDQVEIQIEDTGIGIAPEILPRLFQPFVQADDSFTRRHGGAGLGLVICRELADLMGATLSITSTVGVGTCVTFVLPVASTPSLAAPASRSRRVLVVDDDALNRKLMDKLLRRLGHDPVLASDGAAGLETLMAGGIDLVLMDYAMPGLDGAEVAKHWRDWERKEGRPRIPIIALTASTLPHHREACMAAGMDAFLNKPVDLAILREALDHPGTAG